MRFAALVLASFAAVDPLGWDRFGPLRWALISTIGFAIVAAALLREPVRSWWLPRWTTLGWGLVLAGTLLSAALSDDRWHAFVGTPDRHFGFLTWLLAGGLFWAVGLRAMSAAGTVAVAATIGVGAAGAYTVAELTGLGGFDSGFAGDRAGGPFGQPAFLGAAMVLGLPLATATAIRVTDRWWRRAALGATGLGIVALAASQSRAAWVGVAIVVFLLVWFRRDELARRIGPGPVAVSVAIAVGAILLLALLTPLGARAWSLTDVTDGVVAGRVDEWQVASRALFDSDTSGLLGLGPETYRTVFGRHVDEQYVIEHGRAVITDRAHNSVLDTALAGGLVAAVGLLLLHGGILVTAVVSMRSGGLLDTALAASAAAYLVQQLFLFPLAELDPVFWIVSGLLVARTSLAGRGEVGDPVALVLGPAAAALALIAGAAGMLDVAADHRIDAAAGTEGPPALAAADDARSLRPDSIRYHFVAARIAYRTISSQSLDRALERVEDGLDISPADPALLTERARVLLDRARLSDDRGDMDAAVDALGELDRIDPNHPENQQRYGIALALAGRPVAAETALRHAAALAPTELEPLLNLAIVQFESGEPDAALETLDAAEALDPSDRRVHTLREEILSG